MSQKGTTKQPTTFPISKKKNKKKKRHCLISKGSACPRPIVFRFKSISNFSVDDFEKIVDGLFI